MHIDKRCVIATMVAGNGLTHIQQAMPISEMTEVQDRCIQKMVLLIFQLTAPIGAANICDIRS